MSDPVHAEDALTAEIERLRAERDAALERAEYLEEALERIIKWAGAYPVAVFPEMTDDYAKRAHAALVAQGMTLDRVSAHAMRHVIEGVGKIAAAALADATEEGDVTDQEKLTIAYRDQRDRAVAEIVDLRYRVARLEAALRPFADAYRAAVQELPWMWEAAAAALADAPEEET